MDGGSVKIFSLPNMISISRIFLSPVMYFLWGNRLMLFLLLILISFTDIFDGYIARKSNQQTVIGAWLDSIADFVFFISFIIFAVMFESVIIVEFRYYILLIIGIKLFSGIAGLLKYKRPGFLHTIGNKITATIVIAGFCVFVLFRNTLIVEIGLYIAIISALEECIIILLENKYEPDIKGIWEVHF